MRIERRKFPPNNEMQETEHIGDINNLTSPENCCIYYH